MPMFMCDVNTMPRESEGTNATMPCQSWDTDDRLHCSTTGGVGGVRTLTSTECRVCPPAQPPSAVVCSAPLPSTTGCRRVGSRTPGKVATSFRATDVRARLISYGCGRRSGATVTWRVCVCVCVCVCMCVCTTLPDLEVVQPFPELL